MKTMRQTILFATAVLWLSTSFAQDTAGERPAEWARPMTLAGVPNLFQISSNLYRCAQPTAEGMKALEKMGVKTVLNLRSMHTDKDELKGTALIGKDIPMVAWHPKEDQILSFLSIATDSRNYPVVFHCQHGADRTGTMCAIYRIFLCGWTKEAAIREMTEGGYGFHIVWDNLIDFIRKLDVEAIRKKANLEAQSNR